MYQRNRPPIGSQIDYAHPLGKGMVCAILFNERGGNIVNDISGNSHSGIATACAWTPLGRDGQGLYFDAAASYVTLIDTKKLSVIGGDLTVAAWITETVVTSYRGIIGNSFANGWWLSTNAGKICIWIAGIGTAYSATTTMAANRWYHVAATFINSTKKIAFYLDGKPDGTATSSTNLGDGGTTFYLGKDARGNANYWFGGTMAGIYVWNRALTGQEIGNIYYDTYAPILDPQRGWLQPGIMGEATPPAPGGGMAPSMFFMD